MGNYYILLKILRTRSTINIDISTVINEYVTPSYSPTKKVCCKHRNEMMLIHVLMCVTLNGNNS